MAQGRIRVLSTIPGPANLGPIVREFCKKEGLITALSDSAIKTLAGLAPEGSGCEAIPFGGLVRRFATLCGELPFPVAHEGHVVAAVGAACEELPSDSPFARTAHRSGLHKALAATLHELSEFGLDPEAYEAMAPVLPTALAAKVRSLAEVETKASETLKTLGRNLSRDHYRICLDGQPEKGADLGRVLVIAGADYNPQAIHLLQWAAAHGARIDVVVYRHATGAGLFHGARLTAESLATPSPLRGRGSVNLSVAKENRGEGASDTQVPEGRRSVNPRVAKENRAEGASGACEEIGTANELLQHLFAETSAEAPDIKCAVVSAADPLAEAEWALRGCLERHRAGMPYERMALYVRDSVSYAPLIESASKRLGVPVRMWRRAPLLTNSFARLTQTALLFCASKDVRSLLPMARTTYVGLDFEARETLQAGLKTAHSARGEQWNRLREWQVEHSDKFGWLEKLLDWRDEAMASPAPLEVWIGRLRDLMTLLPLQEGGAGGHERDKRAGYVLQQSLNRIASVRRVRQPRSLTLAEFARCAEEVWAEADVSVPAGEQGVLVTAQAEALPELRCLFVLGMLEGVFPRRRSEDPILSDFDREAMSGDRTLPLSRDKAEAERDTFYMVCASASEEIVFSYPETDEERDNVPAFYLDEVERALGQITKVTRPRQRLTPDPSECLSGSDREIAEALASPDRAESLPLAFSNPFTASAFERNPAQGLGPRELREALQCPFSFFARRTLKVRPERLRARWYSLVGLPQKGGLIDQKTPDAAQDALGVALEAQLDEIYSDAPEWEIALLRSGGRRLIREWIEREFAARKLWPREDLRSEVRFGEQGLLEDLPKIAKLSGGVAATSRRGPYSVVHLVETSAPAKGYGPANELPEHDKLYFGLHLLAAWNRNGAAAVEVETMAGERLLMLLPRRPGVNLPACVQDGLRVVDLGDGEDSHGVRTFFEDVKKLAREAVARIHGVDVRAIRGDHCAVCDYGELCRSSLEFGEEDSPFADDL
ncbi:MAG TPA: hypothetical protein VHE55_07855 [Fimbriimonadaceae bacterium]|nr:hypothetical protein [Fimbriimonadaceae bacterium]